MLVGDRGGFDLTRSTKSHHHSRTGVPTIILINRHKTSVRGPAQSSKDEYAAYNNKSKIVFFTPGHINVKIDIESLWFQRYRHSCHDQLPLRCNYLIQMDEKYSGGRYLKGNSKPIYCPCLVKFPLNSSTSSIFLLIEFDYTSYGIGITVSRTFYFMA